MKRAVLVLALVFGLVFSACGQDVNDFRWVENNGEITITRYVGERTDVRIPRRINGLPVVAIRVGAFMQNRLTSVSIPANVDIQPHSFHLIVVYKQYNLNGRAETTFSISLSAYNNFEIAILNGSMVEITNYTGNANEVRIPERINGLPVVAIGRGAFIHNQLTSVSIPNSVSYIGSGAFTHNQLTSVSIPNSVSHIGDGAFDPNVNITRR